MNIKIIVQMILIIFVVFALVGCDSNDYDLVVCKSTYQAKMIESDTICTLTYNIYYSNKIVKKIYVTEEYKLENGSIEDLIGFSESTDYTFNQDYFNVKGFTYSSELYDTTFIMKMTLDYTVLDINNISDDIKGFFFSEQVGDEYDNVSLEKLINYYSALGFECKEAG